MDAVEFLQELKRRSERADGTYFRSLLVRTINPVSLVDEIERWSKKHPIKTRQSEFLKMFPNANIASDDDTIRIAPCDLDISLRNGDKCKKFSCAECCCDYWLQEVE